MIILKDELFLSNLKAILRHIAKDSKTRANSFNNSLFVKINNLSNMPYKFRQSHYYDDKQIRDLIFKGYTVPYLIDEEKEVIVLLDIFKWFSR